MTIEIQEALERLYGSLGDVPTAILNAVEEIDNNIAIANEDFDHLNSVQVLCLMKYIYDHRDQL